MVINNVDLPNGWEIKKLGEIADFLDNKRKPINEEERRTRLINCKTKYPYYGANDQVGWIDDYIFDEELVLLAEDGGFFGSNIKPISYIIKGKSWVNNHAHVLKAKNGYLNMWILYSLMFYDINDYVGGTTRLKLNKSTAENLLIKCPPYKTQQKFVNKISMFFENYNKMMIDQKSEPNAERLMQTTINKLMSGLETQESALLGDLISEGPQNGIYKSKTFYGKGIPILRIDNIHDRKFVKEDIKKLELTESELKNYNLKKGNIILNRVNSEEHIGKCCVYEGEFDDCVFESNMMRFNVDDTKLNPRYLMYYISSKNGLEQLKAKMKKAINQVSVNQEDIKSVNVPILPLQEQKEIVTKLDLINESLLLVNDELKLKEKALNLLPHAVLNKAFKGEL